MTVYTPRFRYPSDAFRWKVRYAYEGMAHNSAWASDRAERRAIRVRLARKFREGLPTLLERLRDLE